MIARAFFCFALPILCRARGIGCVLATLTFSPHFARGAAQPSPIIARCACLASMLEARCTRCGRTALASTLVGDAISVATRFVLTLYAVCTFFCTVDGAHGSPRGNLGACRARTDLDGALAISRSLDRRRLFIVALVAHGERLACFGRRFEIVTVVAAFALAPGMPWAVGPGCRRAVRAVAALFLCALSILRGRRVCQLVLRLRVTRRLPVQALVLLGVEIDAHLYRARYAELCGMRGARLSRCALAAVVAMTNFEGALSIMVLCWSDLSIVHVGVASRGMLFTSVRGEPVPCVAQSTFFSGVLGACAAPCPRAVVACADVFRALSIGSFARCCGLVRSARTRSGPRVAQRAGAVAAGKVKVAGTRCALGRVVVWARVACRRFSVRACALVCSARSISRRIGSHLFVLAAVTLGPAEARLGTEPVTTVTTRTMRAAVLGAVIAAGCGAPRAGAFVRAAGAILGGTWSLRLDRGGRIACGVRRAGRPSKGAGGLVRV